MKIKIVRRMPEWRVETWHVEIPDDTPEEQIEDVALDAMYDGNGDMVHEESDGYIDMLDGNIDSATKLDEPRELPERVEDYTDAELDGEIAFYAGIDLTGNEPFLLAQACMLKEKIRRMEIA